MDLNTDAFNSSNLSLYKNACRTCLVEAKEDRGKKNIFQNNVNKKIESLTSINLSEENGLSSFICSLCYEKLNNAAQFKEQIGRVVDVLNRYLNNLSETQHIVLKNEYIPTVIGSSPRRSGRKLQILKEKKQKYGEKTEGASMVFTEDETNGIDEISKRGLQKESDKANPTIRKQKKIINCPTCNRKLKNTSSLKIHLRTHGVVEKNFECGKCGKKYTNQYDLRVHLRKHSGIRPFSCKDCGKTFADQRCLEKHKKIHSAEKLFKCELCDKSFIHAYTLKTHLRVHSGEKPFVCAKCGHSFSTTTQLKLHTRIHHTQEKPYVCKICPKVFASSSGLSNHVMTHTGERKFICSVCGKGSRTTSDLKCHLRTHTGERPFKCTFPDCDKKYKTNSQLCAHIRTHTGEQNHKCSDCLENFSSAAQLKTHCCNY